MACCIPLHCNGLYDNEERRGIAKHYFQPRQQQMPDTNEPWYAVRMVIALGIRSARGRLPCFEERIAVVRADSFRDAYARGRAATLAYADSVGGVLCDYCEVFHIVDKDICDGTEVFSSIRPSRLSAPAYILRYLGGDHRGSADSEDTRRKFETSRNVPGAKATLRRKNRQMRQVRARTHNARAK